MDASAPGMSSSAGPLPSARYATVPSEVGTTRTGAVSTSGPPLPDPHPARTAAAQHAASIQLTGNLMRWPGPRSGRSPVSEALCGHRHETSTSSPPFIICLKVVQRYLGRSGQSGPPARSLPAGYPARPGAQRLWCTGIPRDVDPHAQITGDVPRLLRPVRSVYHDVLSVGADPGLGELRRAVGHDGCHEAQARAAEQVKQAG